MKKDEIEKLRMARIKGEQKRVLENLSIRTEEPKSVWWLSFCDPAKPAGSQFLGVVIVHARESDFPEALMMASLRGLNPGGECVGHPIPAEYAQLIPDKWLNRLLSKAECEEMDAEMKAILAQ